MRGARTEWLTLLCAALLGAAGVGFVIGLHTNARVVPELVTFPVAGPGDASVRQAPHYSVLADHPLGINRSVIHQIVDLVAEEPAEPGAVLDAEARAELRRRRAERRAYAGAPPVVPHVINQTDSVSCLVCHGEGKRIGALIAPKPSHPPYVNCQQCHVEASHRTVDLSVPSTFVGAAEHPGSRAYPSAPPTMPHPRSMREDCQSCHGPLGQPALRTTHPERINCQQCHAPSAALDGWQTLKGGEHVGP